ncbi:MAG: hypothetical protein U0929_06070 [Planctomycetaceae bacterium]
MSDQTLPYMKSITNLWNLLSLGEWNDEVIAAELVADCGVDACGLTPADFERLFGGDATVPWEDIAWSLNESMACYTAGDKANKIPDREFGRAVVAACILAEAISRGHGCWDCSFDKMVRLIGRNMSKGDFEFRMAYFRHITACMAD